MTCFEQDKQRITEQCQDFSLPTFSIKRLGIYKEHGRDSEGFRLLMLKLQYVRNIIVLIYQTSGVDRTRKLKFVLLLLFNDFSIAIE